MSDTRIVLNSEYIKGQINPLIYSSFVEHMGRVVYSGIFEPGHPDADEDGFRTDVMEKMKNLGVTAVRYPGGNFVSGYHWQDGVGPIENRPKRRELAWKSIETNEFGTDEFMKWANKTGIVPIMAVNLGTQGIENALSLLEYCNMETGTYYSDLRAKNGHKNPYGIKYWCLGNEMDGEWQIGHKTAEEYGRIAAETAKTMKLMDPSIKLIGCGSSSSRMESFPDWERITLEHTYEYTDYIAVHQYYGNQKWGTKEFLAQSLDMERYLQIVIDACDMVQYKKRSNKQMMISVDEWGVWSIPDTEVKKSVDQNDWQIAPPISEQIYSMEDSLLFASMLMNFVKFSNRVQIACQSLLTNISACIMTEKNGESWVQPIYYPFAYMAKYGHGTVLDSRATGTSYFSEREGTVPYIDHVEVKDDKRIACFLVNRCEEAAQKVCYEFEKLGDISVIDSYTMVNADRKATNQHQHDKVKMEKNQNAIVKENQLEALLPPLSFNVILLNIS
jgi:alpha-N-arabinofuranosidase